MFTDDTSIVLPSAIYNNFYNYIYSFISNENLFVVSTIESLYKSTEDFGGIVFLNNKNYSDLQHQCQTKSHKMTQYITNTITNIRFILHYILC